MGNLSNFLKRSTSLIVSTLLVFAGLQLLAVTTAPAANAAASLSWTLTSAFTGQGNTQNVATSATGDKVFMGTATRAYLSTNYGNTWSEITALQNKTGGYQQAVAMSSNGAKLFYAYNNQIWYSWDSGATWTNTRSFNNACTIWNLSASSDGTKLVAGGRDCGNYAYSTNSGQSWTTVADSFGGGWAVAMSGDGSKMVISERSGNPRVGPVGGTLSPVSFGSTNVASKDWRGIECDNTCATIVIANCAGGLLTSSDSGTTWTLGSNPAVTSGWNTLQFYDVATNSDGSKLAATVGWDVRMGIYVSTDRGLTWTTQTLSTGTSVAWEGIVISSDGTYIYSNSGESNARVARASFPTASTTSLTPASTSSTYGSTNTLTATVSPNTATGTVDFKNNGTSISGCNAATVTAGVATCSTWKPGVGTYTNLTAVYSGDGSLQTSTSSAASLSVTAAPLTITASSPNTTYGASTPSVTAAYAGLVNGDASSVVTGLTCSTAYTTASAVASAPATSCSGASASNYSISYLAGSVTISKATPTFNAWTIAGKTYGASSFDLVAPTASTTGTFTYSSGSPSVVTIAGTNANVVGSGSSLITATFTPADTTNFNSGGITSATITVSKAVLGITASSHLVAFGDAIPTINPGFAGFLNGDSENVLTNLVCSTAYTTSTPVGTIASSCSGATASNYSFVYTAGVITISQGAQTSSLAITSTSATYGTPLALTASGGSGSGALSYFVNSGPCTVSGSTLTATGAGTCMVTVTKAANGNFLAASSTSTAISVARKNLTIVGLTGVNKEFDHGLTSSVTGTPSLFGVVGADDVLLDGTPVFTFATADVANGKTVTASGFTLAGTTADNYTFSQPTVTANITKKAARVVATDVTVAFGSTVSGAFTTSGLLGGDAVSTSAYTFSGTGTSSAPTAVGVYSITPSNAVFGAGSIGNYEITYVASVLTILAKYTITYNANGGLLASGATSSLDFVVGDSALSLPTPTRANFTFTGWFTLQTNGTQVTGSYTPIANATLWARWVQNSLYGIGSNTKILTITTLSGVGNTYSASAGGGTIAIEYLADALPAGTVIDAFVLADTANAAAAIGAGNNYVMSLVLAWLAPDGTVPTTANGKPISMTITNASIKRGAKIYSVIGSNSTLLGTATVDGSATVSITDDPQIFIAITRPDAPTGILATSGVNAGSNITWSAPVSDGGSEITGYTVTSSTGETCVSVTTTCSMTGLTNGVAYTFTVTATNAIGTSTTSIASLTATPAAPVVNSPVSQPAPDTSAADRALAEAKAKALADAKAAAELKAAADLKAAAEAKALADSKAAADAAKANALNGKVKNPSVSLYSLSASMKLSAYDNAYLKKYLSTLKASTTVTCTGYIYPSSTSKAKAKALAVSQATALCKTIKSYKPSLKTSIATFDSKLAPKAAKGSKWVGVSYRVDGRTGA